MENLPFYISIVIGLTTLLTLAFIYRATHYSKRFAIGIILWLLLQSIISLTGFYIKSYAIPPRFSLLILPPLILIVVLFSTDRGRQFIDAADIETLTLLHTIRIPVEVVLYWLFLHKAVPEIMTFEGKNFDILSGLTAPLIYYFGFIKKQLSSGVILLWNCACLGLLINIVSTAILAAPTPFQKFAFDQPNIAVLYFPFVWLPCFIVPVVLLSHLAAIRSVVRLKNKNNLPQLGVCLKSKTSIISK
jgi:hypothetical protein